MINPKILILPDIHGRTFYQKALSEAIDKGRKSSALEITWIRIQVMTCMNKVSLLR